MEFHGIIISWSIIQHMARQTVDHIYKDIYTYNWRMLQYVKWHMIIMLQQQYNTVLHNRNDYMHTNSIAHIIVTGFIAGVFLHLRVPQALQFLGVLKYSDSLLKKLQKGMFV